MFSPFLSLLFFPTKKIGWWFQPLWNILVSWDDDIPNIWKNKTCSKPPTRSYGFPMVFLWFSYGFPRFSATNPSPGPNGQAFAPPQVPFRCQGHRRPGAPGGAKRWRSINGTFSQLPCFLTWGNWENSHYNHDYIFIIYMIIIFPIIYYNYTWLYMFFASASINKIEM